MTLFSIEREDEREWFSENVQKKSVLLKMVDDWKILLDYILNVQQAPEEVHRMKKFYRFSASKNLIFFNFDTPCPL